MLADSILLILLSGLVAPLPPSALSPSVSHPSPNLVLGRALGPEFSQHNWSIGQYSRDLTELLKLTVANDKALAYLKSPSLSLLLLGSTLWSIPELLISAREVRLSIITFSNKQN